MAIDTGALEEMGLTRAEAKTYVSLVELGQTTAGKAIEKSRLQSSVVYNALKSLIEKGLVSYVKIGKDRHYQAASPSRLLVQLDQKKKAVEELATELEKLEKLREAEKLEAEIIVGSKAMTTFKANLISDAHPGDEYLNFMRSEEIRDEADLRRAERITRMKLEKGLKIRVLAYNDSMPRLMVSEPELIRRQNLRFTDFEFPQGITIFRNMTILSSYEGAPMAVVIRSSHFAKQFRRFFYSIYDKAESRDRELMSLRQSFKRLPQKG